MMSRLVSFLQQLAPAVGFKKISLLKTWRLTDKKTRRRARNARRPVPFFEQKKSSVTRSEILYTPSQKFV